MTRNENRPDPPSSRPLAALVLFAGSLAVVAVAIIGASGCGKAPKGASSDDGPGIAPGDPWKTAGQRLKKDSDLVGVRTALGGLANDLNTQNKEPLPVLSDPELAKLAELVPLSAGDREEVRSTTFTAHDSAYLADCLYLRDAARSLALDGLPPEAKAEAAFAWVCRQVYLRPWVRLVGRPDGGSMAQGTAIPPTAVLRRGFGSGLERMYVFLALLQQLGLDGCLIGAPTAGTEPAGLLVPAPDKKSLVTGAPRGPFWAVGVRVGADVKLFDPWRGQSFPVTLAQLKTNPDAAQAWFADAANVSGVTLDDAKKATAFLAIPVNALSPRMATLDAKLKADLGGKLAYNARALRDSFPDPKPAFWNPPDDPQFPNSFAYGWAARAFLPNDLGGTDRGEPGRRLYDAYQADQIPTTVFKLPDALAPIPARERLGGGAAQMLVLSFIELPNPRERIQRGLFQDAAKDLVTKQETFASGLERLRLNKDADEQIGMWIDTANELYQELGRARLKKDAGAETTVLAQIENNWKHPGVRFLLDRSAAEVGLAEAMFLLALCKHELAERGQGRVDRATGTELARLRPDAIDSWKTALSAWRTYEQLASAHAGFPGRSASARALALRAEQLAKPRN